MTSTGSKPSHQVALGRHHGIVLHRCLETVGSICVVIPAVQEEGMLPREDQRFLFGGCAPKYLNRRRETDGDSSDKPLTVAGTKALVHRGAHLVA